MYIGDYRIVCALLRKTDKRAEAAAKLIGIALSNPQVLEMFDISYVESFVLEILARADQRLQKQAPLDVVLCLE